MAHRDARHANQPPPAPALEELVADLCDHWKRNKTAKRSAPDAKQRKPMPRPGLGKR